MTMSQSNEPDRELDGEPGRKHDGQADRAPDLFSVPLKLIVRSRSSSGRIEATFADGSHATVRLEPRHVKVLVVMIDAIRVDESLDPSLRGWISDAEIAEAYARLETSPAMSPDAESIRAYRSQINTLLRAAAPAGVVVPGLFESERTLGVRLATPIQIVLLTARRHPL